MPAKRPRPIAIAVFSHQGRILCMRGHDTIRNQTFYRPLGGGIEYGEHSADALRREINEELRTSISDVRLLGVIESVFTLEGQHKHELVFAYDAVFDDRSLYDRAVVEGMEADGVPIHAYWMALGDFQENKALLVPEALLGLVFNAGRPSHG